MSVTDPLFELDDGIDGGAQLEQVVPLLGGVVAQVRPADLALSTPCAAWTTRDLLNHLVGGATMFAGALGGGPVGDISGRLPDAIGDDPMAAFGAAAGAFGEAAGAPGALDRVLDLPFGAMTGRTFLRFVAFDLLVHSWDLATTIGVEVDAPDDLVADIDAFARALLTPLPRDDASFAVAVAVPADATPLEALVAFSGRQP